MVKRAKLENLNQYFKKGEDFELTDAQYEKKTGAPLPKDKYYLRSKSALAKKAMELGFEIEVIEKKVIFRKN